MTFVPNDSGTSLTISIINYTDLMSTEIEIKLIIININVSNRSIAFNPLNRTW